MDAADPDTEAHKPAVAGTGASSIVWGSSSPARGPILVAYSGQQLNNVLWTSNDTAADAVKVRTKFSPPVIANGKVYIMTDVSTMTVYGLK